MQDELECMMGYESREGICQLDFCYCFSLALDLYKFIIILVPEADIDYSSLKLITATR